MKHVQRIKDQEAERGAVLWKAVAKVAQHCDLSRKDLEDILGYSQATLSRLYQTNRAIDIHSKSAEIAILLLRLYKSLSANVGGDDKAAQAWLKNKNYYFNAKPIDHIRTITGLIEVVGYLDAMRGKL